MTSTPTPTKMLFVDDDPGARKSFLRVVERRGYAVDLASDGLEAIRMAEKQAYPVVVTDLRMPGMDGLSLITQLQSILAQTTYVILTGVPQPDLQRDQRIDRSLASIIRKPWNEDELIETLERALNFRRPKSLMNPFEVGHGLPRKILLVEDNPGDAKLIEVYLKQICPEDQLLEHVTRLDTALERVYENSYLMMLTDLSLPDASGLDAVARLTVAAPRTPMVVLSGFKDEHLALSALELGAQDFLLKDRIDRFSLMRAIRFSIQRKRAEQQLINLAHYDPLTGLANRNTFHESIVRALSRGERKRESFGLMFLDLDRFKEVNDTHGHEIGDLLLQEASQRLRSAVREYDTVARLGGDEFAVLIEGPIQPEEIEQMGERILRKLQLPFQLNSKMIQVTGSVGSALYPAHGRSVEKLLRAADTAMYAAKRGGRNNLKVFETQH